MGSEMTTKLSSIGSGSIHFTRTPPATSCPHSTLILVSAATSRMAAGRCPLWQPWESWLTVGGGVDGRHWFLDGQGEAEDARRSR